MNNPLNIKKTFFFPAEWSQQEAVILSWPHNERTWPVQLDAVQNTYLQIIKELAGLQRIWLLVGSASVAHNVKELCAAQKIPHSHVEFLEFQTDDAWVRDYGPLFVFDEEKMPHILKWQFNGWGEKYDERGYVFDNLIPHKISQFCQVPVVEFDFILEGGSLDSNGCGTILTSKSCLLNHNRNAQFSMQEIETVVKKCFGATNLVWVDDGVVGDDTDGHIDDVARFIDPQTIVCVSEEDPQDENYLILQDVHRKLAESTDQNGKPFIIKALPMPDPVFFEGQRLPASYANFLITNHKILVPTYRCPKKDEAALALLQQCFPARQVVGIDCTDIVYGLGAIHCLSQQVPLLKS